MQANLHAFFYFHFFLSPNDFMYLCAKEKKPVSPVSASLPFSEYLKHKS